MYYVYINICTYSSYERQSGLINIVYTSADVFLMFCTGRRLSDTVYLVLFSVYVEQVTKYVIA